MEYFDLIKRARLYTLTIGISFLYGYAELRFAQLDSLFEELHSSRTEFNVKNALDCREFSEHIAIDQKEWEEKNAKLLEAVKVRLEKERADLEVELRELQKARLEELNVEKGKFKQWKIDLERSLQ